MTVFIVYGYDGTTDFVDRVFRDKGKAREYVQKQGDGFMVQEVEVEE